MAKLIKWEVSPAHTGMYRSFEKRCWPTGFVKGGRNRVLLRCDDEYIPARVRNGDHGEISIHLDVLTGGHFRLARLKTTAKTLDEAKELAEAFFRKHPDTIKKETSQ